MIDDLPTEPAYEADSPFRPKRVPTKPKTAPKAAPKAAPVAKAAPAAKAAPKAPPKAAPIFDVAAKSKDPERDLSALSAAARAKAIEVMGQLGKLGDETFPARILEYVGLRSKIYSILTVGARKEKRKIKGVPKKAVTNVRHLESERRSPPLTTRSTASTLTTRGRWGTGATGAAADAGRLRSARLSTL